MANLIIDIDCAGWTNTTDAARSAAEPAASLHPFVPTWQNVTSDEMGVKVERGDGMFPSLSDIASVRSYFRALIGQRGGAIISCDLTSVGELKAVKCVSKYPAGRAMAMAYTASIIVPVGAEIVELSIRGSEQGITGVREALVMIDLTQAAGPSERRQLENKIIPIEWKFERYEPDIEANGRSYSAMTKSTIHGFPIILFQACAVYCVVWSAHLTSRKNAPLRWKCRQECKKVRANLGAPWQSCVIDFCRPPKTRTPWLIPLCRSSQSRFARWR